MKKSEANAFRVQHADALRITNGNVFVNFKPARVTYPAVKSIVGIMRERSNTVLRYLDQNEQVKSIALSDVLFVMS